MKEFVKENWLKVVVFILWGFVVVKIVIEFGL